MPAFSTTRWTLIARAQGTSEDARGALAELCRAYWQPIFAFIRRSHDAEAALDLTQGFFMLLLERELHRHVDRSRGRFRSFLMAALRHYLSDERARAGARKRGGGAVIVSLDAGGAEEGHAAAVSDEDSPERAFERAWAQTVLGRALERLRGEHEAAGKADRFESLRGLLTEESPARCAEIGARLGMTGNAVKVAVFRLRQRLRQLLLEEVADTVADEEDAEAELRELLCALER